MKSVSFGSLEWKILWDLKWLLNEYHTLDNPKKLTVKASFQNLKKKNLIFPFLWDDDKKNKQTKNVIIFAFLIGVPDGPAEFLQNILSLYENTSFISRWH